MITEIRIITPNWAIKVKVQDGVTYMNVDNVDTDTGVHIASLPLTDPEREQLIFALANINKPDEVK